MSSRRNYIRRRRNKKRKINKKKLLLLLMVVILFVVGAFKLTQGAILAIQNISSNKEKSSIEISSENE